MLCLSVLFACLHGAGDRTQRVAHARQAFHHWANPSPAFNFLRDCPQWLHHVVFSLSWHRAPSSPHPRRHCSFPLCSSTYSGRWHPVGLICVSLVPSVVELFDTLQPLGISPRDGFHSFWIPALLCLKQQVWDYGLGTPRRPSDPCRDPKVKTVFILICETVLVRRHSPPCTQM
jgi:hypothetical protein